jgi:hypothetical protein
MSTQFICTIQTSAAVSLMSVKSTSRDSPARGQVLNRRVGIHEGLPFGACLWKYAWPWMPCGYRLSVKGRSRRRHDRVADLDVVLHEIALGHAVLGKEDALGMREPDRAPADPDLLGGHRYRMHCGASE